MTAAPDPTARRSELAAGLAAVRRRIEDAATAAGRNPDALTLVVVTKTFPLSDIRLLAELGVGDLGESRDQEASAKAAGTTDLDLRWHFIGRLQTNKARSVAGYASVVHSVDRASLLGPLVRGAQRAGRQLDCLVQVSLDGDPARGGIPIDGLAALADAVAGQAALRLAGLMAVAPIDADPLVAFAVLPDLSARLRADHPAAGVISAGMSGDLEAAVANGATHLRVGSAVLGHRPPLR